MTTVVSSLLAVMLLSLAVSAAPVPTTADYHYQHIVPYGPYPAPGYVVSYLPKYASYRVVTPISYHPSKDKYDKDQHKDDEPKYYYGGKFKGVCLIDGLYYKDDMSFVVCSNGYASHQPCPPGTKTDKFPSYKAGYYYGSSDLCSVNLVDLGYGPQSYMSQFPSYDDHVPSSYEDKKPAPSYDSEKPKKDTYPPHDNSYDPPKDPYQPTTYDTTYPALPPYPPRSHYQPPDQSPPLQNTYPVDHPHGEYPTSYQPSADTESYPPNDSYQSPTDYHHPVDSFKPSPPLDDSSDTEHYYKPSPSYYAHPHAPVTYKLGRGSSYSDQDKPYQTEGDAEQQRH